MGTPYKEIHTALDRLLHLGVTPVVAHIERYKCLEKNEERVQEMIDMGCYMQINSSSVLKPRLFGDEQKQLKKRARYFLEKDLVHFVASDMHNVDKTTALYGRSLSLDQGRIRRTTSTSSLCQQSRTLVSG